MPKLAGRDYPLSATPTPSAISSGPGKPDLIDRIFGTAESRAANKEKRQERRADNKLDRENNRLERQAYRGERRGQRQANRSCGRGSCGGRALGFSGYN